MSFRIGKAFWIIFKIDLVQVGFMINTLQNVNYYSLLLRIQRKIFGRKCLQRDLMKTHISFLGELKQLYI